MRQHMEIDGGRAEPEDLGLALVGYGHFTYMQVRGRRTRGLDLHLERLERSTRELFGRGVDRGRVLSHIRHALDTAGRDDASVRVQVFAGDPEALMSGADGEPRTLVMVRPPAEPDGTPQRLRTVTHERLLPHLKHLDTMGLIHHARRARQDGFDDALLTDHAGRVTEATLANVVLHDDDGFVWPDSPALHGIARGLLRRGLALLEAPVRDRTVHRDELTRYRSAFLTNSISPAQPVASVDDTRFTVEESARSLLLKAYEANPWEPLA